MSLSVYLLKLSFVAGLCSASPISRIVLGTETSIEAFPSIVQLDYFDPPTDTWSQRCGGSILNELYILTAAHCNDIFWDNYFTPENRRIRAGATFRNTGGVLTDVASVLNHPKYDQEVLTDADFSIIRLRQLLSFGDVIRSVAILPQDFEIPDNAPVTAAGWGMTSWDWDNIANDTSSPVLLYVNQQHSTGCVGVYPDSLTDYMICSISLNNDIDGACGGDSGGPLYYGGVLAGTVSWSNYPCDTNRGTVYGRVAAVTDWILENTPSILL